VETVTNVQKAEFQKTTLDNGLRVVTSEVAHVRSASIGVFVGVGSRYESEAQSGISHFIEHMVFKGTRRRPTPGEISGAIEGVGGLLNAATEQELTSYWCKVPDFHVEESLDVIFDMLRGSVFNPDDVEKERMVIVEELNMINDQPNYKVDALIDEMLWPDHPLGRDIGGTKESIGDIKGDAMVGYMADSYTPNNVVVSVAGVVDHDKVVEQIATLSKDWPGGTPAPWTPVTHRHQESQVRVEYRSTEQTHLSIAVPGLSMRHPDRYALSLLSVILGEGMSSRLFVELRETKGLAYDVHSGVAQFLDSGAFVVSAGVDPKRVYDAVETIMEQLSNLKDGVPEEELEKAKTLVAGRLLLRMEDNWTIANWMGPQELLLDEITGVDDVIDSINAVGPKDIRKVANDLLVGERLNMAVVGPCRGRRRLERLLKL
jgi:predicted Zn-dependent peptidase